MFTGLIQSLGTIHLQAEDKLRIYCSGKAADPILQDLAMGDSVAVDGVCLTVEEILPAGFVADASPETLRRTTLGGKIEEDAWVNLETAVRVGTKLGGHFVTGHVDGIGCLQTVELAGNSWEMSFTAPESIARYIVLKGSIAVNGISLTVADCNSAGTWFKVAVIPHTFTQTNLSHLKIGSWVNLEGDILGKYIEKLLLSRSNAVFAHQDEITPAFLSEHGYL
ncbi:riboflavin synthase [Planktothrix sp. FACHB-1355]|uniref:Riboflavin synthase n=1 Tax=Aerosakkonema funiforme FACHB-1375 TaxID=2949571 RepID=A0A926ZI73_9CYAN|nr:riboflavin synthase [Aerosakkonema funiforme]MBD2183785.1 riboflavin synthase [Aerosakkonema funiforme FACHB-1375]MBD3557720.1 riboflavin synthase [Planktothrix sp. FACHB-1355]